MTSDLSEAYNRLHHYGPEFGGDEEGNHGMTNHGPMAMEVVVRRGLDIDLPRWLDRYTRRLSELPEASEPITAESWPLALGHARRLPDWTAWFSCQLQDRPWPTVLAEWWPRLMPGVIAGSTHGVIRVGHAVRAIQAYGPSEPAQQELAHGLAFWAARYRELPASGVPPRERPVGHALHDVARLSDQTGLIAHRVDRLTNTPGWPATRRSPREVTAPDIPELLADLVEAGTRQYLAAGAAAPVLLVHAATAPNAVRHVLPSLPASMWADSYDAVWAAAAALTAMYAPRKQARPRIRVLDKDPADAALDRAAHHGDEHVLKFTDTAVEAYQRNGDPHLIAAASYAATLIARP